MAVVLGAGIAAVPATITALITKRNASQHSVDRLHDCVEDLRGDFQLHAMQDELRFDELSRLVSGTK